MLPVLLQLLCIVAWAVYVSRKVTKQVHMLQLNSYRNLRYWKWYKGNVSRTFRYAELLLAAGPVLLALGYDYAGYASWLVLTALLYVTIPKEIEKKKLVYTARVKRLLTTIAVVLLAAVAASYWVTSVLFAVMLVLVLLPAAVVFLANTLNKPIENGINNYYINDARNKLKQHSQLLVIGITGSFGKTSVKHFLSTVLSQSYNVLMTPESYNTPLGVTKTVRMNLQPTHEVFVCEMGAKQVGDIREICDIALPKYGILTAIGEQHLDTFKSLANVQRTKFELIESLPADGVGFINLDDANIADQLPRASIKCRLVTYGIENEDRDYCAYDIRYSRSGCSFKAKHRDGESHEFETMLLGEHNIYNLIACIAVGHTMGIPFKKLAAHIKKVKPVKHRLELKRNGNITILDDSFNSNPIGSKAALSVLAQMPEKKILITPGMIELGEKEYDYNYAFGEEAAKVCDYIVLVGPEQTKPMQDALAAVNYTNVKVARNLQEALQFLQTITTEHAVVLLENDLPDNYNE